MLRLESVMVMYWLFWINLLNRVIMNLAFWEALCLGNLARLLNDMAQVDFSLYPEAEKPIFWQ